MPGAGAAADGADSGPCTALATADIWPHPLTAAGRSVRPVVLAPETTLADLIRRELPGTLGDPRAAGATDIDAMVDSRPVPRAAWAATRLSAGQIVTLRTTAGDGGDGKNPLRTILQLAVLFAAIYVPPLLAASSFAQALIGAAITIVGGLLVDAIAPPPLPDQSRPGTPEPVYSLTGGANRARPYDPLLLVLGAHRVFPDIGAAEYTETDGDDQFLHAIFHFGLGDLEVDALKIGGTDLVSYEEVATEWGDARGRIGLVAGNVDTVPGGALETTAFVERTTGLATGKIGVDIVGRLFRYDGGNIKTHAVTIEVEWHAPDGASGSDTVDLSHDSQSTFRQTLTYDLPAAKEWTVRVRRTTEPADDDEIYDDLTWAALRGYQADEADYGGQTRLGVRIRASGQLSGRLDRLSAMVQQKVPVWDGAAWTAPQVTSNPAWIFRWYARGIYRATPDRLSARLIAGVGLPPARIDDAALIAWGNWCEAQRLRCDYVIERPISHADVLTMIARCGRASVTWQTGKLGVIWDEAGRPMTTLVTPGNVVAGSFRVEYATGAVAEEVAVRYREPELDWQYNVLRRTVPDVVGPPTTTATVTLDGVANREQAAMACNLQVARQRYHRRRLIWDMAAEGLGLARGDVVAITHSLIDGGAAGRLAGGTARRVTLDREVDPTANSHALFRMADGRLHQTEVSRPPGVAGRTAELMLADPLPSPPDRAGGNPIDVLWRFYDAELPPVKARIIAMQPRSDRRVRCVAIDEVDAYYALATSDLSAPFPDVISRIPEVVGVAFTPRRVRIGRGYAIELEAVLTVRGDWRGATVRAGPSFGDLAVVDRLVDGATVARWIVPPDTGQAVEIVPGSEIAPAGPRWRGTWMLELGPPPPPPSGLDVDEYEDGTRIYRWVPPDVPDLEGVVLRYAADAAAAWDDMTALHAGFLTSSPYEALAPPEGTWTVAGRSVSTSGLMSSTASVRVTLGPQRRRGPAWFFVTGVPPAALGVNDDFALRVDTYELYQKRAGAWVKVADFTGADGATWHTGSGLPAPGLGEDGDWYFRTSNAGIYRKINGAWSFLLDLDGADGADGATWHSGNGAPSAGLGKAGDWYFRTDNGWIYEKTGATVWTFRRDITGPQGIAGATWHSGVGVPPATLGKDGDFYLRTFDSSVWKKASGAWTEVASFAGADGATWHTGSGLPAAGLGKDGDWYFRTSNAGVYRKLNGAWRFLLDIDGADGAVWHGGSGAPPAGLGKAGDWYFRTDNGWVYEKTGATVWSFRRDLTGEQGDPASRGPGMFSYLVTLAQQRQLEASPSALPAAFATIANDLTPGGNLNGDFVRFWRPGFVQLWTWRAATSRWERATGFIGAGEILAVSISALVGNFSDLNVGDKLTAQHIDTDSIRADVFNVGKLFESTSGLWVGAPFQSVVQTVALADDLDDYDLLLIGYSEGRSSGDPTASAIVSTGRLMAGNVGIGHAEAAHIRYARGSNGRALNFTAASGNRHYLYAVYGLIDPRDASSPPPPPPPPPPATTWGVTSATLTRSATHLSLDNFGSPRLPDEWVAGGEGYVTTIGVGLVAGNINLFIAATASGDGNAAGPELVDAVENDPNFRVNMWNDTRGESFSTTRQSISSDDQAEPYAITPANGAAIAATIADWQAGDSVRVSFLITP